MRESKYPLERWGSPLPLSYSTLNQIAERTTLDLNFLTAARGQGWIDVVMEISCLEVWLFDLSVATRYGASRSYASIHNLATYLWWFLNRITLPSKTVSQVAFLTDFSSLRTPNENHQLLFMKPDRWGRLLVHYPKHFRQSTCWKPCPFFASSESFQGSLLVWHIFANLETEWMYPLQPWRYLW
jgi:hypothetical protein